MTLPFSESAFLDVFGAYNVRLWPVVAVLWALTAAMVGRWLGGRTEGRPLLAVLAFHWLWSGVAYHWGFFRSINPAATVFAALFVVQGAAFAWVAVMSPSRFQIAPSVRGVLGAALAVYGLIYPFLGLAFGLRYPRLPLFGVPCPTALVTAGLLLTATGIPRLVNVVPFVWAAIGAFAATLLGIRADLALVPACALLIVDTIAPRALGSRLPE
jgi:hypothetical protein